MERASAGRVSCFGAKVVVCCSIGGSVRWAGPMNAITWEKLCPVNREQWGWPCLAQLLTYIVTKLTFEVFNRHTRISVNRDSLDKCAGQVHAIGPYGTVSYLILTKSVTFTNATE